MRSLLPALACNAWLDSASFRASLRHTSPRLTLCVMPLTLATGARQFIAKRGQPHRSGGGKTFPGIRTRMSNAAFRRRGTALGVNEKLAAALACNALLYRLAEQNKMNQAVGHQ